MEENKKPIKITSKQHTVLPDDEKDKYREVKEYFNGVEWREANQEKLWQQLLNIPVKTRQVFRLIEQPVEEKKEQSINQRWEALEQRNIETPFEYNMEENKHPSPTIKEGEQQEETVEQYAARIAGLKPGFNYTEEAYYQQGKIQLMEAIIAACNWQKKQQPKGEKETAILDAGTSLEHEVFVIERRPVYSTIQAFGDGQKPYDAMTNRLSANYSMEAKERGEQESLTSVEEIWDKFSYYIGDSLSDFEMVSGRSILLPQDYKAFAADVVKYQTTTLQAEIEELKATNNALSILVKDDPEMYKVQSLTLQDEVEELRAERERYRNALTKIYQMSDCGSYLDTILNMKSKASKALTPQNHERNK